MTTKFFPKGVQIDYVKPIPDEPDFIGGYSNGLAYRIIRHPKMGHLCGYVKLTKNHPLYKAATAKINKPHWRKPKAVRMLRRGYELHDIEQLDVHGGVTFFDKLSWARGYWIGFDCAHCDDLVPGITWADKSMLVGLEYRDVAFVKGEIDRLAQQLSSMAASFGSYQNRRG